MALLPSGYSHLKIFSPSSYYKTLSALTHVFCGTSTGPGNKNYIIFSDGLCHRL
jgi:hypothetical protein